MRVVPQRCRRRYTRRDKANHVLPTVTRYVVPWVVDASEEYGAFNPPFQNTRKIWGAISASGLVPAGGPVELLTVAVRRSQPGRESSGADGSLQRDCVVITPGFSPAFSAAPGATVGARSRLQGWVGRRMRVKPPRFHAHAIKSYSTPGYGKPDSACQRRYSDLLTLSVRS